MRKLVDQSCVLGAIENGKPTDGIAVSFGSTGRDHPALWWGFPEDILETRAVAILCIIKELNQSR
jgi:hypothetical protein